MKSKTYDEFVEKFKPKLTTDDCYTPPMVYEAVANWTASEYGLDRSAFVRPFYPGGDYENFDYSGKIVVDNPPFSMLSKIVNFYVNRGIKFLLFAPTLVSVIRLSDVCSVLCTGVDITYENGAVVTTGFVTNLEDKKIRMRTPPSLYKAVDEANKINRAKDKRQLPKYTYPIEVVTSAAIYPYSKYGIDFVIPRLESARISALDAQRKCKKTVFGGGLLISERLAAEREKAEREKAERWVLSEREREIIKAMAHEIKDGDVISIAPDKKCNSGSDK